MGKRNIRLKKTLLDLGLSQREFSKRSGINEWYLSTFINGKYPLREEQKQKILTALNAVLPPWGAVTEENLFGGDDA
jgi:hypothetical protein